MKILIIGTPRSGTTSLIRAIGKSLNLTRIGEPFNYGHPFIETSESIFDIEDNTIVKTLYDHTPKLEEDNPFNFLIKFSKEFDLVILLSRKDKTKILESIAHQYKHNKNGDWHQPYIYDDTLNTDEYVEHIDFVVSGIKKLSTELNIPITWYEDLYSGDLNKIEKFLRDNKLPIETEEFFKFVDPKLRYRIYPQKIRII